MLHFKRLDHIDKACTGMEAFSLLLPEGWGFGGGVGWSMDNVIMPASCGFEAEGGGVTMRAIPGRAFFWTCLPQVRLGHPVGSRYLGATVCPMMSARDVIKTLLLPSLRPDAVNVRIIDESPDIIIGDMKGFGAAFVSNGSPSSEAARIRVEYELSGTEYEEELFCIVESLKYSVPSGPGLDFTFWTADNLFSFMAKKGELDKQAGTLQAVMRSFRLNPAWFEKYNRIVLYLKERQVFKPYSLRQMSTDVDKAPGVDAHRATSFYSSYLQRQSAYRWIADNLGGSRHTGEYYDPIQQICVSLPCGYDHAWANESGEYLLSNRQDLQPESFTEIWKIMEPISLDAPYRDASTAAVS